MADDREPTELHDLQAEVRALRAFVGLLVAAIEQEAPAITHHVQDFTARSQPSAEGMGGWSRQRSERILGIARNFGGSILPSA